MSRSTGAGIYFPDEVNQSEVSDGGGAQDAYLEITAPETPLSRKAHLIEALRRYCERDTLGMVRIVERMRQLGEAGKERERL